MPAVAVRDLTKRFNSSNVVDQLNFEVEQGELFGLLGPNGAGKTTTVHVLCTLLKPSAGSAFVNSFDVVRDALPVRQSIGLVFQENTLDKDLTVEENLRFACDLQDMPKAAARARIADLLEKLDLAERRDTMVKSLSGGLKRRLDIARGVLHRPKVLFLDEPTTGLDPHARAALWRLTGELRTRENITVLLTTHDMEEAEACDRVAILDCGKLIALGAPAELKRSYQEPSLHGVFLRLTGRGIV